MKYQTILFKYFFGLKGAVYFEAIATMIFSHVKISSFRARVHLIFHWCLYDKTIYLGLLKRIKSLEENANF